MVFRTMLLIQLPGFAEHCNIDNVVVGCQKKKTSSMVTMKPTERDKCKNRFQQIMRDGNSRTDNQSKQAAA